MGLINAGIEAGRIVKVSSISGQGTTKKPKEVLGRDCAS